MITLNFKDPQDMINNIAIKEKTNYFICECPECSGNEAYVYKSNMNLLKCSRENECGIEIQLKYDTYKKEIDFKEDETIKQQEIELSNKITNYYDNHINRDFKSDIKYRGLESDILKCADVFMLPNTHKFEIDFKSDKPVLFGTSKQDLMSRTAHYDMIFPFRDENGKITRLVYRSLDDDQYVKEYCKTVVQKSSDVLKLNMNNDIIIVSESILDGLSIKQSYDAGLYACRGVTKSKTLIYELSKDKDFWQHKTLLIAFDNDNAGNKYADELSIKCESLNIEYIKLQVPGDDKDWNDILQRYSKDFLSSTIDTQIREQLTKYLNKNEVDKLVSLAEKHINVSLKNKFLQNYYLNVFSSQINVGPINSLILDLQYENSFYATENVVQELAKSKNPNLKDFDCKLLKQESKTIFKAEDGRFKMLHEANHNEQKLLENGLLDVRHELSNNLISSRIALSKDMINRSLDINKANDFCVALLAKYSYQVLFSADAIYNHTKVDNNIELSTRISSDEIFKILTREVISQNENINDNFIDTAHQLFLSNFNMEKISVNDKIATLDDVRMLMKINHALVKVFDSYNLFEYQMNDIISAPKVGLEKEAEGGDYHKINKSVVNMFE